VATKKRFSSITALIIISALALALQNPKGGISWINEVHAAGGKVTSPTGTAPDRYVYYPGGAAQPGRHLLVVRTG
jgi:hypothetical protein